MCRVTPRLRHLDGRLFLFPAGFADFSLPVSTYSDTLENIHILAIRFFRYFNMCLYYSLSISLTASATFWACPSVSPMRSKPCHESVQQPCLRIKGTFSVISKCNKKNVKTIRVSLMIIYYMLYPTAINQTELISL
jgi:hypothetical protein